MPKRDVKLFICDIEESCGAIVEFTKSLNFEDFKQDRKTYSAVIREFEIIGEAVKHLPKELTDQYSNIGWKDIIDFRNLLIHGYFGVDFEIVWNTIKSDLPVLYQAIKDLKNKLD